MYHDGCSNSQLLQVGKTANHVLSLEQKILIEIHSSKVKKTSLMFHWYVTFNMWTNSVSHSLVSDRQTDYRNPCMRRGLIVNDISAHNNMGCVLGSLFLVTDFQSRRMC